MCIVVSLPFTALHYDTHDNLLLIILSGGDLERLARETEGEITVHIIAFDLLNWQNDSLVAQCKRDRRKELQCLFWCAWLIELAKWLAFFPWQTNLAKTKPFGVSKPWCSVFYNGFWFAANVLMPLVAELNLKPPLNFFFFWSNWTYESLFVMCRVFWKRSTSLVWRSCNDAYQRTRCKHSYSQGKSGNLARKWL